MIVFPTIRHTGSHFVVKLFGYDINKAMSWKHDGQGEYVFDHIHPANAKYFMPLLRQNTVVVPLRHPKCVAVSWRDRQWEEQEMIDCWDFLVKEIDPLKPHYLPIDSPHRDLFLARLNFDLGLSLETLWEPAGVKHNNQSLRHEEVQASFAVEALCERIKPFLDRFYEDTHEKVSHSELQAGTHPEVLQERPS